MSEPLRVCRKCLLYAQAEASFRQSVEQYLASLDPEDAADQALYEERLAVCSACPNQISGMCRLCGCYVELRAAQLHRVCPEVPARW